MIKVPKTDRYVVRELNVGLGQPVSLQAEWVLLSAGFTHDGGVKLLVLVPVAAAGKPMLTEGNDATQKAAAGGTA